ncbi:MAG: methionyl-tRNA formyltransferase [bacterium]
MKYIFFGTPQFAATVLEPLLQANMPPCALVCNPDRPVGRKKIITPPQTKKLLNHYDTSIPILQPDRIDETFLKTLTTFQANFFVVAAYAKILPDTLIAIPKYGTIGVHPSLLPQLRGSSPLQTAILEHVRTGVTLYKIDKHVDHGPILSTRVLNEDIDTYTYTKLEDTLARMGAKLLMTTLPRLMDGTIVPQTQNHEMATFTRKFKTEDGYVPLELLQKAQDGDNDHARMIDSKIRALTPEPGVYTIQDGKRIKLLQAKIVDSTLKLITIQKEGKRPTTCPH